MLDTNILIYLIESGSDLHHWAVRSSEAALGRGPVAISAIVIGELAARPMTNDQIDFIFDALPIEQVPFGRCGAVLAGHAHAQYRLAGGPRERLLGDFLIGGHALAVGASLMTRDARRYRRYFPERPLITPETHP